MFEFDFRQTRLMMLASISMAVVCWQNDTMFYAFCLTALMVAVGNGASK